MKNIKVGVYSKGKNSLKTNRPIGKSARVINSNTPILASEDTEHSKKKSTHKKNKKSKTQKSKKKRKIFSGKLVTIFLLLCVFGLFGFGYYRIQALNGRVEKFDEEGNKVECTNILNPSCWTEAFKPQLKQTDGFTNMMIIGLDTRAHKGDLKNTDSIIVASFNHETEQTMLISFPRDLYIQDYATKINAIYAFTYLQNPEDPFIKLKEELGEIIGMPIHYTTTIRFEGVISAIDELGGVEVCPEDAFTARYPNDTAQPWEAQWLYYDFPAGCQKISGEQALVYARFRYLKSGPGYLASDFSRARRQQEVIEGLKDAALAQDLSISERAETYWSLLETLGDSIDFDLSFEDILATLAFIDSADSDPLNVVLDPNFVNLNEVIYTDSSTGLYTIKFKDNTYSQTQKELQDIWDHADAYKENPKIVVLNLSGEYIGLDHITAKLQDELKYYDLYKYETGTQTDLFTGIKVYDMSAGTKPGSLEYIIDYLGLEGVETEPAETLGITRTANEEDILIVVGPAPAPTVAPTTVVE